MKKRAFFSCSRFLIELLPFLLSFYSAEVSRPAAGSTVGMGMVLCQVIFCDAAAVDFLFVVGS